MEAAAIVPVLAIRVFMSATWRAIAQLRDRGRAQWENRAATIRRKADCRTAIST